MNGPRTTARLAVTAMGCPCEVLVVGGGHTTGGAAGLAHRAARRIAELESHWSRFVPTSDISRLNALARHSEQTGAEADTVALDVHWSTIEVLRHAIEAWHLTGGRYDPTIERALVAQGYDRSFTQLRTSAPPVARPGRPAPGCAGILIEDTTVRVPIGVGLDLGGIGKGYAADLVVADLLEQGADGVLVNLGGDVRVSGLPPAGDAWVIALDSSETPGCELPELRLADGAVAVSSTLSRRWTTLVGQSHHIIDPRTGRPTGPGLVGAVVIAGAGWWAEVLTKAVLVAGPLDTGRVLQGVGVSAHAMTISPDNRVTTDEGFRRFVSTRRLSSTTRPNPADPTGPRSADTPKVTT